MLPPPSSRLPLPASVHIRCDEERRGGEEGGNKRKPPPPPLFERRKGARSQVSSSTSLSLSLSLQSSPHVLCKFPLLEREEARKMLLEKKKVCSNLINAANSQKKTSGLLQRVIFPPPACFIYFTSSCDIFSSPPKKTFSPANTQKSILLLPCHNTWAASTNFESYSTRPFSLSLVLARGRLLSTSTQIAVTMGGVAGQWGG